jgi:hypothetical protein
MVRSPQLNDRRAVCPGFDGKAMPEGRGRAGRKLADCG